MRRHRYHHRHRRHRRRSYLDDIAEVGASTQCSTTHRLRHNISANGYFKYFPNRTLCAYEISSISACRSPIRFLTVIERSRDDFFYCFPRWHWQWCSIVECWRNRKSGQHDVVQLQIAHKHVRPFRLIFFFSFAQHRQTGWLTRTRRVKKSTF